jgi:hypothetical protein
MVCFDTNFYTLGLALSVITYAFGWSNPAAERIPKKVGGALI